MIKHMFFCGLMAMSTVALAQPADTAKPADSASEPVRGDQKVASAKPKKITDRNHPDYIRCRTESVIGSRAKKRRICLTNTQWREVARNGNEVTEEFIRTHRSGLSGS